MPKYTIEWTERTAYYAIIEGADPEDALQRFYDAEAPIVLEPTGWCEMEPDSVKVFEENSKKPIDMTAP